MDKPYEIIDEKLSNILDNDVNLVIVLQYIQYVIDGAPVDPNPIYEGEYYCAPDIMHRFTKAMPYFTKYKIQQSLSILIEKGFVIKDKFYTTDNSKSKTMGYRINTARLNWESQFIPLQTLVFSNGSNEINKEIKDLTNKFIFNIREAFSKKQAT